MLSLINTTNSSHSKSCDEMEIVAMVFHRGNTVPSFLLHIFEGDNIPNFHGMDAKLSSLGTYAH